MMKETVHAANGRKALVVTMNSNKVNAINPAMLDDFEKALSHLERQPLPVVLTGEPGNSVMCAGLDLVALFGVERSRSRALVFDVLSRLGVCVERLYSLPRPTVAALSGHALAGGAVVANSCDFRVGVAGSRAGFGAIEVPVGVPFPAWAFVTTFNATPTTQRADALLYGKRYSHDEALRVGILSDAAADAASLVEKAVERATVLPEGSSRAFAMVKELMVEQAVQYCREKGPRIMDKVMETLYSDEGWNHIQGTISNMQKKK